MPGVEAAFDVTLAAVVGGLLVGRLRALRAGQDVSVAVAIAPDVREARSIGPGRA